MGFSIIYTDYWTRYLEIEGFKSKNVSQINNMRALMSKGMCSDENEGIAQFMVNPDMPDLIEFIYANAQHFTPPLIYLRLRSIEQIKEYIYNRAPVGTIIPLFESFEEADDFGLVPMPGEDEDIKDKHCISLVSFSDRKVMTAPNGSITGSGFFKFWNTAGVEWGDKGYGYISYEYYEQLSEDSFCYEIINNKKLRTSIKRKFSYKIKKNKIRCKLYRDTSALSWIKNIILLFAYFNNQRIGWIIGTQGYDEIIEIVDFFVWPEYRNQGLGTELMKRFIKYCTRFAKRIEGWLNYVDARWDGMGIIAGYYAKFGFTFVEDRQTYRWAKAKFILDIQ